MSERIKVQGEVDTISLKEAQQWARRWRRKEGHYNKHHHLHAFLIPKADLIEVLVEGIDAARAYIGINDEGVEKLMIVGTKKDPKTGVYVDMITEGYHGPKSSKITDSIYDFTKPCPTACDPSSPMNI